MRFVNLLKRLAVNNQLTEANLQYFCPLGMTQRYNPFPSASFLGALEGGSSGLAFLHSLSLSFISWHLSVLEIGKCWYLVLFSVGIPSKVPTFFLDFASFYRI